MRTLAIFLAVFVLTIVFGCSGGDSPVVTPGTDQIVSETNDAIDGVNVLLSGTMNLEEGTMELGRDSAGYLDVTGLVGGNFSYRIEGMPQPETLELTLSLTNASGIMVYDVNIVFGNLYGKKVLNPDSYTDIFHPGSINPFISFRKDQPDRNFPGGVTDEQQLLLKWPAGASPFVDFFIIAHLPGNTGGVYQIKDWNVLGRLTPDGEVNVEVSVFDHQGDITAVLADTRMFNNVLTPFSLKSAPVWEALIENQNGVGPGDYNIIVGSTSPATPAYITYNIFPITVETDPGDANVRSFMFYEMVDGDTWHDIGVQPGGFVYVVADHPATGNTGGIPPNGTRTALQFSNDLSTMVVLNPGTGMASPQHAGSSEYDSNWNRIGVSDGGNLLTNVNGGLLYTWSVSGDTATVEAFGHVQCGMRIGTVNDVDGHNSASFGPGLVGLGTIHELCASANWILGFSDTDLENYNGGNWSDNEWLFADRYSVAGIAGINGTNNILVLYDDEIDANLSIVGNAYSLTTDLSVIDSTGTPGTGDGEFMGALDVTIDGNGQILTLENHAPGVSRFQKFDAQLNWIYSTPWVDGGNPLRMDFDTSSNNLYLLTDQGIHICEVE